MKQVVKYSILPGILVAVVNALYLWILLRVKIIGQGNSNYNDLGLGFIVYMFLFYILTIALSAFLSRKASLLLSFVFALLSILVVDFVSCFFLGISNQSDYGFGRNLNLETIFGPVLMTYNYMLLNRPILVVSITLLVVTLTKVIYKFVKRFKSRQSVGKTKKSSNKF